MIEFFSNFLINNWLEAFGMLSGLVYIVLSVKQNIWLWPIGFATSFIYAIIFFRSTLYADMGLQIYYLVVSIYGWYHWIKGKNKNTDSEKLQISLLKPYQWFVSVIATVVFGLLFYIIMKNYTNASNPLADGMITSGSIVATWMLARKILDQWLVWIIVDGASIALFIVKGLYLTSFLTLIYTILAIWGYYKWRKEYLAYKNA